MTFLQNWRVLYEALGPIVIAAALGCIFYLILWKTAQRLSRHTRTVLDDLMVKHLKGPAFLVFLLLSLHYALPFIALEESLRSLLSQTFSLSFMISAAWLIIKLTSVVEEFLLDKFRLDIEDNLRARTIHTQIQILKKITVVVICVLTFAAILMNFGRVRQLGTSILASAGIIGIILGVAAQRSIATLLAGIQLALTQPIRLDDVVVVENEWGRIEEITLTYVVVKIWDQRRMVLPVTYFMETPFQNWTRTSADILGTV